MGGNKLLLVYIRDVLLMKDSESEAEVFHTMLQGIQLKHLSSLRTVLQNKTMVDPLEKINEVYRDVLPAGAAKAALTSFANGVVESGNMAVLLTSLKDFMVEYLCDDVATMSKKCSFADDV